MTYYWPYGVLDYFIFQINALWKFLNHILPYQIKYDWWEDNSNSVPKLNERIAKVSNWSREELICNDAISYVDLKMKYASKMITSNFNYYYDTPPIIAFKKKILI